MKKFFVLFLMATLCFWQVDLAMTEPTGNHTVTVTVAIISKIEVVGGNFGLTVTAFSPATSNDNTKSDLTWETNEASKKITVETSLSAPNFTLKVVSQNVTGGTAASEVTLSTTGANDFVHGIATTAGGCDLSYTASATSGDGTGSDAHVVTYTILTP